MGSNLIDTPGASQFLQVSEATLKSWRALGIGPPYIRVIGLVKYDLEALQRWLDANTIVPTAAPMPPPVATTGGQS